MSVAFFYQSVEAKIKELGGELTGFSLYNSMGINLFTLDSSDKNISFMIHDPDEWDHNGTDFSIEDSGSFLQRFSGLKNISYASRHGVSDGPWEMNFLSNLVLPNLESLTVPFSHGEILDKFLANNPTIVSLSIDLVEFDYEIKSLPRIVIPENIFAVHFLTIFFSEDDEREDEVNIKLFKEQIGKRFIVSFEEYEQEAFLEATKESSGDTTGLTEDILFKIVKYFPDVSIEYTLKDMLNNTLKDMLNNLLYKNLSSLISFDTLKLALEKGWIRHEVNPAEYVTSKYLPFSEKEKFEIQFRGLPMATWDRRGLKDFIKNKKYDVEDYLDRTDLLDIIDENKWSTTFVSEVSNSDMYSERYYNSRGLLHRVGDAAYFLNNYQDNKITLHHYVNGIKHNSSDPAEINVRLIKDSSGRNVYEREDKYWMNNQYIKSVKSVIESNYLSQNNLALLLVYEDSKTAVLTDVINKELKEKKEIVDALRKFLSVVDFSKLDPSTRNILNKFYGATPHHQSKNDIEDQMMQLNVIEYLANNKLIECFNYISGMETEPREMLIKLFMSVTSLTDINFYH
jgi:hypothetical protein